MLSYAIQKVGFDFDQLEPQGPIDLTGMLRAIDGFPWREQLQDWNEEQDGPLPALVLECEAERRQLWITALGEGLGQDFQLQSVSTQVRKGLFGKPRQEAQCARLRGVQAQHTQPALCTVLRTRI